MNNITVKKRGGETEVFVFDKLLASIGKTGVPLKEATAIAEKINAWVLLPANKGSVTSVQLRDKVIEYISGNFPAEADSYKVYKK
jgi:hypothetical protein